MMQGCPVNGPGAAMMMGAGGSMMPPNAMMAPTMMAPNMSMPNGQMQMPMGSMPPQLMSDGNGGVYQVDPQQMVMASQQQQQPQQAMIPADLSDYQQMQEVNDMSRFGFDGRHRSPDRAMEQMRLLIFLAITYVIVSLPQVESALVRFLPLLGTNIYYVLAFKGVLFALLYYIARYFDLV